MTIARNHHIFQDEPTYYHLMSRCVRRAFLCGKDKHTGKRYDHRKRWLEKRLLSLSALFYIDLYGYAIMSNHYHLVVKTRPDEMSKATTIDVAERWCHLFPQSSVSVEQRIERLINEPDKIACYRTRLSDISWLMRCLNEGLARQANREEGCSGRFWQGRFRSQFLLDESAVYTCMAYVDLNPVRAGLSQTPEASLYTSIYHRLDQRKLDEPISPLNASEESLSMTLSEYLLLVDDTGRSIGNDKSGYMLEKAAPILSRLSLSVPGYMHCVQNLSRLFCRGIGHAARLIELSERLNQKWVKGQSVAKDVFD